MRIGAGRAGALLVGLSGVLLLCYGILVGRRHELFRPRAEQDPVSRQMT